MTALTKWPRLLVTGKTVTEEQANEILIRTDSWSLMGNDRAWARMLSELIGVDQYAMPNWRAIDEFRKSIDALNLHYLNNSRIYSSWIGGPHGWCSWSGRIGCFTYNIGKWPETDEVTEDWTAIAAAFPYLDLTAQLVTEEGEGVLAGQWTVRDGDVQYEPEPTDLIRPVDEVESATVLLSVLAPGGERGASLGRIADALEQVRQSRRDGAL